MWAENHGMECMFTIMNDPLMAVVIGVLGIVARTSQRARAYAPTPRHRPLPRPPAASR